MRAIRDHRGPLASVPLLGLLLGLLLAPACGGGGGGGGGGPTAPPPPAPGITFTATGGSSAAAVTLVRGAASTATTLVLEVRADQVNDLYGLSFDLTYPSAQLRYDGATEGGLLSAGGQPTSLLISPASPGMLVVGFSRLGAVAGAEGSGVLLTLRFTAVGAGTGAFGFARNSALDSSGASLPLTWGGGNVAVVL
jgi:Cohesin domain